MNKDINTAFNFIGKIFTSIASDVISGKYTQSEFQFTIIVETKTSDNTGIIIGEKKVTKSMSRFRAERLLDIIEETIDKLGD